jgi:succinate dehydrogenase/fumarate reductase-like Fe-S protein
MASTKLIICGSNMNEINNSNKEICKCLSHDTDMKNILLAPQAAMNVWVPSKTEDVKIRY